MSGLGGAAMPAPLPPAPLLLLALVLLLALLLLVLALRLALVLLLLVLALVLLPPEPFAITLASTGRWARSLAEAQKRKLADAPRRGSHCDLQVSPPAAPRSPGWHSRSSSPKSPSCRWRFSRS